MARWQASLERGVLVVTVLDFLDEAIWGVRGAADSREEAAFAA